MNYYSFIFSDKFLNYINILYKYIQIIFGISVFLYMIYSKFFETKIFSHYETNLYIKDNVSINPAQNKSWPNYIIDTIDIITLNKYLKDTIPLNIFSLYNNDEIDYEEKTSLYKYDDRIRKIRNIILKDENSDKNNYYDYNLSYITTIYIYI